MMMPASLMLLLKHVVFRLHPFSPLSFPSSLITGHKFFSHLLCISFVNLRQEKGCHSLLTSVVDLAEHAAPFFPVVRM